jgi:amidase
MNDLLLLTARDVVSLLKQRKVSPLELVEAVAKRIEEVDGQINAVPTRCFEQAVERAHDFASNAKGNPPTHYLYGLPVLVKDLTEVKGVRTTYGSPIFADNIPTCSNHLVETLEQNGAIVMGKTNTPEFGAGGNTYNAVFGATRNPWNTAMTCGGSSGGSAAALASGEAWLATGNDLAGSLRTPASFCSVVGFRPSPGRVASGPSPVIFDPLGIEGPMARNVKDAALMLDAQVGQWAGDPLSLPIPKDSFLATTERPWKPRKVAFSADLGIAPVDEQVKSICAKAAGTWQEHGVPVEIAAPNLRQAESIFQTLRASLYVARLGPLLKNHRDQLKPEIVWNIEKGLRLSADDIGEALRLRASLYYDVVKFFETYDLLLCPTVVAPPFDVNINYLDRVGENVFDNYIGWLILTYAISITACPVISIPCGFTDTGLPVGIQIVGAPSRDDRVLSAAAQLEHALDITPKTPIDPRSFQIAP